MQLGMIQGKDECLTFRVGVLRVWMAQMADHRHVGVVAVSGGSQDGFNLVEWDGRAELQHRRPRVHDTKSSEIALHQGTEAGGPLLPSASARVSNYGAALFHWFTRLLAFTVPMPVEKSHPVCVPY